MQKIVDEVIELSEAAGAESAEIKRSVMRKQGKAEDYAFLDAGDLREIMSYPHPKEEELRQYLNGLEPKTLTELVAIMYVGRGDTDDIDQMRSHVASWRKEENVQKLMEKSPLANYLRKGMTKR